ncbi:MAG: glucuronyl hydrolase [Pseudomonas gingeri]
MAAKLDEPTQNRSLIYWYGAALGDRWFADSEARRLAEQAASNLADSWCSELACLPLGSAMGGGSAGDGRISIDPLASTVQLLAGYGDQRGRDRLGRHLHTLTQVLADGRGAYAGHADLQLGLIAGPAGNWSRGQAWAMLGLARAATQYPQPYLRLAEQSAYYWLNSRPEPLVLNRLDQPDAGLDPSATVMAAIALQVLAKAGNDQARWQAQADRLLTAVLRGACFSLDTESAGAFTGLCYSTGEGDVLVESPCSSFFLLAALLVMAGVLDPLDF